MRRTNGTHNKVGVWQCQNSNDPDNVCIASGYLFNDDVLNYISRTHKALDVAVDALNKIDKQLMTGIEMTCQARNALEQITAPEQKE
jgi:hypothetical protein